MTFVAQPYEQFVDDLLTALTGGMVREERQFIGIDELYSLASPGVIPTSIKVFGQRNETFAFFERGIDYDYKTEEEAIAWRPDGRQPDDHSFFYVNYYRGEGQRRLTDRNPGSVTTTLAEAFAREFTVLHKQMEMIYRSAFVDLATGASLDHVATLLGLTRKDARFAGGEVLFKRSTPAPGDITIPTGTLISTDRGTNFETTDRRTLRRGQLSVTAPIRAQLEGPAGRVEANAIKNINRPIFGIESVINEEATFFATEKETDEAFRRRIKGTLERTGRSTLNAIKYSLIEDIPEITEEVIQVTERAEIPGFVEVKLGLESTGDADLVRRIEGSIFNARAAGIRVTHNLPTRTRSESAQRAFAGKPPIPQNGKRHPLESLPPEVLDEMPEGILPLRAEVLIRLTEQNLSASQKESIEDAVRRNVVDSIESLPMGADLIYNKLLGRTVQPEAILDADLFIGAASGGELYQSNLSMEGRKAKIDFHDVSVKLMEESVFIDIGVNLELRAPAQTGTKVTQVLREVIEDAINGALAEVTSKLSKAEVRSKISVAINAANGNLQLIAGDAVVINAFYEETGRLLNNTEEVVLEAHQVPELRDLTIEIKGALDG